MEDTEILLKEDGLIQEDFCKENCERGLSNPLYSNNQNKSKINTRQRRTSLRHIFEGFSKVFKSDELGKEIAAIAFPALLALMADPLASLVDTAFIGRIGPIELGAVGVAVAIFNFVSKLLNFPILNITTSLVAEENALQRVHSEGKELEVGAECSLLDRNQHFLVAYSENLAVNNNIGNGDLRTEQSTDDAQRCHLPAVSTSLVIGTALGLFESCILAWGAGSIMDVMGVPKSSNMRTPAEKYLVLRAIDAPAVVVALAVQGVFRGFKDTKIPLYANVIGNVVHIALDPILMFSLHLGVSGAAIATVVSQYIMTFFLLWKLTKKVILLPPSLFDLELSRFLKNGGLLLARSTGVMFCLTLATSEAARLGVTGMAAHQICTQLWLAASLLSDAVALAGQSIIADALARKDYGNAKAAAFRILQIGLTFGSILSFLLAVGFSSFARIFTDDAQVLGMMAVGMPFVAGTQLINSLAFVFDGIHFGASDFGYAAYSMIVVSAIASGLMLIMTPSLGFSGIWIGLTVLMSLRMFAGFIRVELACGPWKFLKAL